MLNIYELLPTAVFSLTFSSFLHATERLNGSVCRICYTDMGGCILDMLLKVLLCLAKEDATWALISFIFGAKGLKPSF